MQIVQNRARARNEVSNWWGVEARSTTNRNNECIFFKYIHTIIFKNESATCEMKRRVEEEKSDKTGTS